MKKISFIIILLVVFSSILFTGCTHEMVSLYIYKMPEKLVYEIGEELDLSGLELKSIKTDSALLKVYNNNATFSGFESDTPGKKEVEVSHGKFTTSFNIFVANKVVENNDQLKDTLESASDNDIILIKKGEYKAEVIEINNKNLVIGGEGKGKTKIDSFFIIGGTLNSGIINFSDLTENITLIGLDLSIKSKIQDNVVKFDNKQYKTDFGGINSQLAKGLKIISCKLSGFTTGVKIKDAKNCTITGSSFNNLFVGGIEFINSVFNTTVSKNIIQSIGKSTVYVDNDNKQKNIFGIKIGINTDENIGVSLYKNSISKIGIRDNATTVFLNGKTSGNFSSFNYMNNSGAIILHSTSKNNLQTSGLSIFFNSLGSTLNNIMYNTTDDDKINSSSVSYMSL